MPARRARRRTARVWSPDSSCTRSLSRLQCAHGRHGIGAQCLVQVEACEPALLVGQMHLAGGADGERPADRRTLPNPVSACAAATAPWPDTSPDTPAPAVSSTRDASPARGCSAAATMAREAGCSECRASAAASPNASAASAPGRQWLLTTETCGCGQRPGLVEHHGVDAGARLQRLEAAHQHAAPRQRAGRSQRGGRRGQRQGARAGDDQHRHGDAERVRGPCRPPPCGRRRAGDQHAQQERAGDAIGKLGQLRLLDRRALHQWRRSRRTGSARRCARRAR